MALIELSPESTAQPDHGGPPPAYVYRRLGLLLAAALVLALGGAATAAPVLWERAGVLPVDRDVDVATSSDGRFFVLDWGREPPVISAWTPGPAGSTGRDARPSVRELWRVPGPVDPTGNSRYSLTAVPGGPLLFQVGNGTTVLDAGTGRRLWTSPTRVWPMGERAALVLDERFRPGTEYDAESGDPGALYGRSDVLHTEPALSTELHGVDRATGRRLWSDVLPGTIYTTVTDDALIVVGSEALTVREPGTGRVLRERALPQDGPAWVEPAGDTVLVHFGAYGSGGRVAAYATGTLDELWSRNLPDVQENALTCAGMPCEKASKALNVLDPRTGAELWTVPASSSVDLVAFGTGSVVWLQGGAVRRMVDRRTGAPQQDLTGWTSYAATPAGDAYLLTRRAAAGGSEFGLLRPGRRAQPLGSSPEMLTGCRLDVSFAVCRDDARLVVYRYRG